MTLTNQCSGNLGSRVVHILLAACLAVAPAASENLNPVHWTLEAHQSEAAPGSTAVLKLHAEIEPGYHLYSLTTPKGGPIRTTITLRESAGIVNDAVYQRLPQRQLDPSLGVMVEVFAGSVDFLLPATVKNGQAAGPRTITAQVRYQVCSDRICLPPTNREAKAEIAIRDGAPTQSFSAPAGYQKVSIRSASFDTRAGGTLDLHFVLLALGLGFVALFTPCVFPLIPLTVSYFLDPKEGGRAQTIRRALLFGAGIVLFFASVGYAASAVAGPFGVVELASNPWVNLTIAMVFGAIAISMLGGFEFGFPSGLLTSLDGASRRGGLVGTTLLGLTFSLTSFACVGPFMGTLLAASIQTAGWTPLIGMTAFALGLAAPFVLLALFPALLHRLPRNGGWLERVKVVSGFVTLAVMCKYLTTADQVLQLHLLTRERFIAIWFALFLITAFYLLGLLRISGDDRGNTVGLVRVFTGVAVLAFAVSILPGLWGGRLGDLDAFIPPATESGTAPGTPGGVIARSPVWIQNRYDDALAQARREGKPLLVSFSGYACTNCHWAKANLFPDSRVAAALENYVRVELYTDGTDEASHRNQQFEEQRFSTVALPFYAVIDPANERAVAEQAGLTKDPVMFVQFLTDNWPAVPVVADASAKQAVTIMAF